MIQYVRQISLLGTKSEKAIHIIKDSKLLATLKICYIRIPPGWSGAGIECTMHVSNSAAKDSICN